MAENLDILNATLSLLIRAALLAARFSGRVRRRSLKRLAGTDADAKAREILFLKDRVYQLEMQLSILQKQAHKKGKKPRYETRERLLFLWYMEAFQIPRRKVSRYFGIARSTLYRWLHKIEDQKPAGDPANKTPPKSHPSSGRSRKRTSVGAGFESPTSSDCWPPVEHSHRLTRDHLRPAVRVLSVGLREMIRFARYLALEPAYFA